VCPRLGGAAAGFRATLHPAGAAPSAWPKPKNNWKKSYKKNEKNKMARGVRGEWLFCFFRFSDTI